MGYLFLVIGLLMLAAGSLCITHGDLVHPATINSCMFLAAAVLATIGMLSWNEYDLSARTIAIVMVGCLSFFGGSMIVSAAPLVKKGKHSVRNRNWLSNDSLSMGKIIILLLFLFFAIFLRIYETYRLGSQLNLTYSGYGDLASQVRSKFEIINSTANVKFGNGFSVIEKQCEKIVAILGYVCIYQLVKLLFCKKKYANRTWLIMLLALIIILCCIFSLLCGSRGNILYFGVAGCIFLYMFVCREKKSMWRVSLRFVLILTPIALIGLVVFYLAGRLVGRAAASNIIDYITFYLGCGIPSLQSILQRGLPISTGGESTFYGIATFLYKFGFSEHLDPYTPTWVQLGNHWSNAYTMFYRYFMDFQWVGVVLLSFICGFCFAFSYMLAKKYFSISFFVILYGYIGSFLADLSREEFIFSRFISTSTIISIIYMLIISIWLKMSFGKKRLD